MQVMTHKTKKYRWYILLGLLLLIYTIAAAIIAGPKETDEVKQESPTETSGHVQEYSDSPFPDLIPIPPPPVAGSQAISGNKTNQ